MLKLLLLGGTTEARVLAEQLQQAGVDFVYSLAGVTRATALPFTVRRGGFGGVDGMAAWLCNQRSGLVVDVSHPYAAGISANAVAAGKHAGVPVWRYQRPPWQASAGDRWLPVADWPEAVRRLQHYQRPLITLGSSPLRQALDIPPAASWLLRCVPGWHGPLPARIALIRQRGPFSLQQERALFQRANIDVLVSRNSGGPQPAAKSRVAGEYGLPVLMLQRPPTEPADRQFSELEPLITSILALI